MNTSPAKKTQIKTPEQGTLVKRASRSDLNENARNMVEDFYARRLQQDTRELTGNNLQKIGANLTNPQQHLMRNMQKMTQHISQKQAIANLEEANRQAKENQANGAQPDTFNKAINYASMEGPKEIIQECMEEYIDFSLPPEVQDHLTQFWEQTKDDASELLMQHEPAATAASVIHEWSTNDLKGLVSGSLLDNDTIFEHVENGVSSTISLSEVVSEFESDEFLIEDLKNLADLNKDHEIENMTPDRQAG